MTNTYLSHHAKGCLVLGFLSRKFPVLLWKVTLLSFQVTCPSSCVTGLTSPLIPNCFHLFPIYPNVSYSPRFPLSCARVCCSVVYLQPLITVHVLKLRQVHSCLYSDFLALFTQHLRIISRALVRQFSTDGDSHRTKHLRLHTEKPALWLLKMHDGTCHVDDTSVSQVFPC